MILSGQFASDEDVQRFYQEAEAAANLDHSGIVPIYEIGQQDGHHFFSMKLIEGGSLAQHLPRLRQEPRDCVQLIANVARAVHHAHQRGILHRDIKPANILIDTDGSPLLSDLGLAKDTTTDSGLTHTGAVVGTPGYMPPEQAAGEKEITTAADIYAVGAILYEALSGRPPHKGETVMETLRKVIDEEPAMPRSLNRRVDRTLELICMKCLAKNPNDRYTSAGALADDLENWLEGKPVSARPPSVSSLFGAAVKQTIRSAGGAAIIGAVAGLFASAILWITMVGPGLNSIGEVYNRLPSEVPPAVFTLPKAFHILFVPGIIVIFGLWMSLGFITALIVRPKPGAPAIAVGAVSGLLMAITLYCFSTGFIAVFPADPDQTDTTLLANAAIGTPELQQRARQAIRRKYPDFENVKDTDRAYILSRKVVIDGAARLPFQILLGIAATTFACVVPCIGGTLLASHLYERYGGFWSVLFPYLEIMSLIAFGTGLFGIIYWLSLSSKADQSGTIILPGAGYQLALAIALIVAVYAAIKNWRWYWRLVLHAAWLIALLLFFADLFSIMSGYLYAWRNIDAGDWDTAVRRIERRVSASPNWNYGHFVAGAVQARVGNKERYREHCEWVLENYGWTLNPVRADEASKLCLLKPMWLDEDDRELAIELARYGVSRGKGSNFESWFNLLGALVSYREAKYDEVAEWKDSSHSFDNTYVKLTSSLVYSMALAKQGQLELAKLEFDYAVGGIEELRKAGSDGGRMWENDVIFAVLHQEAEVFFELKP